MQRLRLIVLMTVGFTVCTSAAAAERKAYKIVDEKGNVTYSQTPPTQGSESKKIDISPAHSSRGGYAGGGESNRYQRSSDYADQRNQAQQSYQAQRQAAEQKRQESLQAECSRNRGTDCNSPETLRLMESQKIPGGRYYSR